MNRSVRRRLNAARFGERLKRGLCFCDRFVERAFRPLDSQKGNVSQLAGLFVLPNAFANRRFVAKRVEKIVGNLKRLPKMTSKFLKRGETLFGRVRDQPAKLKRRDNERTGFTPVNSR